ncbi:MAG: tRNA lysidine(34) synthetase TilS [Deltaproteobacteria bacterium]|nr:tRNA lysidine(34) synthetase TilS [Deltaproteobacteria bacterium]
MLPLYKNFRSIIRREEFVKEGDLLLLGVSGGVDSMVLFDLLLQLQKEIDFSLAVAHVNYGLRGKESDAQEKLVKKFADQQGLRCFIAKAPALKEQNENFQAAARDFRYHYFTEVAQEIGANKVTTAHTKEDQVETILANLLRGSSLKGLAGMRPKRSLTENISLLRPLLAISKEELIAHARQENIPFIEDSSNASNKYSRNAIRHELLPVIAKLRDQSFEKIVDFGKEIRQLSDYLSCEAAEWLKKYGRDTKEGFWFPRPALLKLPESLRYEILSQAIQKNLPSCQNLKRDHLLRCDQICHSEKGEGVYHLPSEKKFVRSEDNLRIR